MIPDEMKGMIRDCHPPTPQIGLFRQSRDPARTRKYYQEAIQERNVCYFPTMLRKMTARLVPYRLIRRLWIRAVRRILRNYCPYLIPRILELLSTKTTHSRGPYFTKYHQIHLRYEELNTSIRFAQLAGRLVTLGFPYRELFEVDYEYECYLSIVHSANHERMTILYRQLGRKGITKKWPIVLSHSHFHCEIQDMDYHIRSNRLLFLLYAFHRRYTLSREEYDLMTAWIERMKYPSH